MSRGEAIQQDIRNLEKQRDTHLREKGRIGRVANKVREPDYRINVRRVNFRWQRGNKIGMCEHAYIRGFDGKCDADESFWLCHSQLI